MRLHRNRNPEATTGYWEFTKYSVMQALMTGSGRDGLVREMDPDAINREEGRTLAADDAVSSQLALLTLGMTRRRRSGRVRL
ncbi:hypothetical protein PILCRDRAFT_828819 [Piloderma croceum F 1598]|uniref:Nuclear pore complex protein n=1 Tax=Piloderma croceum (strain F 1598) TaxID=765440 RepID=A0A0C3B8X4_PILCF|nr:hypothetical protein PILCRDRAFT_828819 [Piloderma croceum F 1598]